MTGIPKPRKTLRRLGIAIFLGLPALGIAAVMPMQARGQGQPVSPATAGQAVLSIDQSDSTDPVTEGNQVSYTITVGNDEGSGDATNVVLEDNVSPDVDYVSATPSQGTCAPPEGSFQCDLGTIAPHDTATVVLVVTTTDRCSGGGEKVDAFVLTQPCTIENDASASSPDAFDSVSSQETTEVDPPSGANLSLDKSGSPDPVQELNPITYTLNVGNAGSSDANDAVVTDDLPAGTVFNSASTTQGSCAHTATTVTCQLGTVSPGDGPSATVTIIVQAPDVTADTTIENDASVSATDATTAYAQAFTDVLANTGGSTQSDVPPDLKKPLSFTTSTESTANGTPAVDGTDPTAVSLRVPAGGPGGSILLEELSCTHSPCSGPGSGPGPATSGVVLGNVVFNVVPPTGYPTKKPFRATLLYDASLSPMPGPIFYFKDGVTPREIRLRSCLSFQPRGHAPCVVLNTMLHTSDPLTDGDWKVVVKLNSDPRMHK